MDGSIPPNTHRQSDELRSARAIRLAFLAAERAGPAHQPLRVLSSRELEAPIDLSEIEEDSDRHDSLPQIVGYAVIREISRGGQATVYLATQESTGRHVAVKVLAGGAAIVSRHRTRFEREVNALASLRHPNIVGIIDRGRTEDRSFFLVMDFVDGCDFDEYIKQRLDSGVRGTEKLLQLFVKIANAVEEAHKLGIVHRDLKPSNIRIDCRDEPHILDFGLARRPGMEANESRSTTAEGHIVGSLPWSSPEQAAGGDDVTSRSDVYSIGVMIYEAIAGQRPYSVNETLREALDNIARAKPICPSRSKSARRMPRRKHLDAIILKCLAKSPDGRYESAGMLARDLQNLLAGRKVVAAPRTVSGENIVAILGALVLAGVAGTAWHEMRAPTRRAFQLPMIENSIRQQMVRIPTGKFVMNSLLSQDKDPSKSPRVVELGSFSISTTEVTQAQYAEVMGANPCEPSERGPTLPVQNVSWDDAVSFCRRLSAKEHRHYRLPTVAEWQYACEAGIYKPFGETNLNDAGWYAANSNGTLHPVAQKIPNAWGIYDMHGGVAEWCAGEPAGKAEYSGGSVERTPRRAVCGGSFMMSADHCAASSQEIRLGSERRPDIGFRVVLDAAE